MVHMQESRFNRSRRRKTGFLSGPLPYDSIKRKIAFRIVLPILLVVCGYWLGNSVVMPLVTRHGTEFPLPNLTGQQLLEARLTLEDLSLNWETASEEYSPGIEQGVILNQFPVSGTKVKSGRVIKFVVSAGQKMMPVPDVAGLSVRQAIMDLETAGLGLKDISWAFSDTLPEKMVVFTWPAAGKEIALGDSVTLMVNRGRSADFTYMPRLVGLQLTEARLLLQDKSLKEGVVTYRMDDEYLPETVLEQSEPEGAELEAGTEIDLVVSSME